MIKKIKKAIVFTVLSCCLISPIKILAATSTLEYDGAYHTYTYDRVNLNVNGQKLTDLQLNPIIFNDYTLVPARDVFEPIGAKVGWDPDKLQVEIVSDSNIILLTINNEYAKVNGNDVKLDIPAKLINDKTMIPTRFISETLGFDIKWDEPSRTISIDSTIKNVPIVEATTPPVNSTVPIIEPEITQSPAPVPAATLSPIINESAAPIPTATNNTINIPGKTGIAIDKSTQVISTVQNSTTQITSIEQPSGANASYKIVANSAITKVEKSLLTDNRLVLDITNAETKINSTTIIPNDKTMVSEIRVAQNQIAPSLVTRVVFQLNSSSEFTVTISDDRKNILVTFGTNVAKNTVFQTDNTKDFVYIDTINTPSSKVSKLTNPNRIVIDMPYTTMSNLGKFPVKGVFTTDMEVSQVNETIGRVTLYLNNDASFQSVVNGNRLIVTLTKPTYRNINYDNNTKTITIKKMEGYSVDIKEVVATDLYNDKKYIITFKDNLEGMIGYGNYEVGNDQIKSFTIETNLSGKSQLVINENKVLAFDITEDNENIYIKSLLPKQKYSKIVVIDPGHGGHDGGAGYNGLLEKDLNFDIANRTVAILNQDPNIKVYITRYSDVYVELMDRVAFANEIGDEFISIHANSSNVNYSANGLEVYSYPHTNDSTIGLKGSTFAGILQKNLIQATGATDRKIKENSYIVIKYTTIPATLIETGFLSNKEESFKLASSTYRQKIAESIYKSIVESFTVYKPAR